MERREGGKVGERKERSCDSQKVGRNTWKHIVNPRM